MPPKPTGNFLPYLVLPIHSERLISDPNYYTLIFNASVGNHHNTFTAESIHKCKELTYVNKPPPQYVRAHITNDRLGRKLELEEEFNVRKTKWNETRVESTVGSVEDKEEDSVAMYYEYLKTSSGSCRKLVKMGGVLSCGYSGDHNHMDGNKVRE